MTTKSESEKYLDYCITNCDWNTKKFQPKGPMEQAAALNKLLASSKMKGISETDQEFLISQLGMTGTEYAQTR